MAEISVLDIRSWSDVRAFIHVAAPTVGATLMGSSAFMGEHGAALTAVIGLLVALTSPALSVANTASGFRAWFYPVLGAGGAALGTFGIVTDTQWGLYSAIAVILLGAGTASANTPTTSSWSIKADPAVVAARAPISE
ncbi:membrane protein [Gordonia phage Bantam]|uniref:Membrane protein n=1 Tax=Gordonia phage Bantam TaxID=1887641 RepID=A0A1B3AY96_9CAUD|nr:holin [Gordonia phage Bantam]AOE43723.1 membrane protein [Gordonia phage Bantam]